MEEDQLFERLWTGAAAMEEWAAAVSGGVAKPVTDSIIAIHTGYLFGNATAVRTDAGLVLVDTGSRETASQTLASLRRWDDSPVHTVIYTHGHIDHTWGAPASRPGGRGERDCAAPHHCSSQCPLSFRSLRCDARTEQPGHGPPVQPAWLHVPRGASPPRRGLRQ